jgi:plasmid stability protein
MKRGVRQYTIRNIPPQVDRVLRQRAKESGKSFNQVALEALLEGTGQRPKPPRDFSGIVRSLTEREAQEIENEIELQRQIDPSLWK